MVSTLVETTWAAGSRSSRQAPVVASYTEWDPLEEVVVGRLAGGVFPTWQGSMAAVVPDGSAEIFQRHGGTLFPVEHVAAAERELDELVRVLTAEGVTVVRPEPLVFTDSFATPNWRSRGDSIPACRGIY